MSPTPLQRMFASKWLVRIWFSTASMISVVFCLVATGFRLGHLADWKLAFWYVFIGIVAGAFGLLLGIFPGAIVLAPLFHHRGLSNGAPFQEGDTVQVLTGPYRGTIAQVYSRWQGDTVRVGLGAVAEKNFGDVFSPTELLRRTLTERNEAPNE